MNAKPKMILLDYGHTLIGESAFNSQRGTEAVMRHAVKNPQGLSPELIDKFFSELFFSICGKVRKIGAELHNMQCQRFVYEYLQIKFDVPLCEIEQIFWDSAAPGSIMPYADRMLAYLYIKPQSSEVDELRFFTLDQMPENISPPQRKPLNRYKEQFGGSY